MHLLRAKESDLNMPSIHRRKLLPVGNSIAVVLPPSWLKYYKLKPGDEVVLVVDNEVTVAPLKEKEKGGEES